MSSIWRRLSGKRCPHEHRLVVKSVGVRRSVCEECGHLSFEMGPAPQTALRDIDRTKLARAAGF